MIGQDQILCNYQHDWTGCIPLLAVRNMPLSPLTCPCVLELGHRLSLVAVVRSADQRLAIAIIQEQTVAKKRPPASPTGGKLLARLKSQTCEKSGGTHPAEEIHGRRVMARLSPDKTLPHPPQTARLVTVARWQRFHKSGIPEFVPTFSRLSQNATHGSCCKLSVDVS
jgi:hypothetical protein